MSSFVITKNDLLNYYKNNYLSFHDLCHIENFLKKKSIHVTKKKATNFTTTDFNLIIINNQNCDGLSIENFNLESIDIDYDVFENKMTLDKKKISNDIKIQNYLNLQKSHKVNFYKEIKSKNLKLKKDDNEYENKKKKKIRLNY